MDLAVAQMDGILLGLAKGYMTKYLNHLADTNAGEGAHQSFVRKNAVADGQNETYVLLQEQEYSMESMAPGQGIMYMIHVLTTSGRDKVSGLSRAPEALSVNTVGGTPGHVYCSRAIQLMFAAGQHIGTLTDNEEAKERSAPNSAPRKVGGKRKRDLSWDN